MSKPNYLFFYTIEKFFARYFTSILHVVSREDYELCIRKQLKEKECIYYIQNGVDFRSRFNPKSISKEEQLKLKREFFINSDDIVFTFIGRLVREKGIFELLHAFQKLMESSNHVKLLIVGDLSISERDQESLKKMLLIIKNNPCITLTGFRKDIPQILSITDVFVLPSHREGLPFVILEAMAMKKPIIATNIRGCREEVIHNENGFLVEKGNVVELYARLKQLAENKEMRLQFGNNSRKIVEKKFDDREILNRQLNIYRNISEE